jgi:hypothetical protein
LEEKPVRLKTLAVIFLLFLGCSAAFGQTYSLGFLSYDQKTQYCDYEVVTVTTPFATGVHHLDDCFVGIEDNITKAVMVGVMTAKIPASSGSPVTGSAVTLADNSIEAGNFSGPCGCVVLYITKLQAATAEQIQAGTPYGWEIYYSYEPGLEFLGAYGFLTKELGGPNPNAASYYSAD